MYSRCSHCKSQHSVTAEQLRQSRGLLVCVTCGERYDALASISDQANDVLPDMPLANQMELTDKPRSSSIWQIGSAIMLIVLVGQVICFEGQELSQQRAFRSGLQRICDWIHCQLPAYKNLDELSASHASLQAAADHNYAFKALISNQGRFRQAYPELKLTLVDFVGQALAERIFIPAEYLPKMAQLAGGESVEIQINIIAPSAEIGGYTFSIL